MPINNSLSLIFHVACKSHNHFLGKAILYFCFIVGFFWLIKVAYVLHNSMIITKSHGCVKSIP